MIGALDHVALGVSDIEERIAFFTHQLGMVVKRRGTHFKTGGAIVLLSDRNGFKIELIESDVAAPTFLHLAYRVDDVVEEAERLVQQGCESIRGPHALKASMSVTALVRDPAGMEIQVIRYEPGSPDR